MLRTPSARFSLLTLAGGGFVLGILFWGGFNTAMEASNTLEFCISCHEMRDTVYQEYRKTIHFANRTGVRAICADCHVPRDWVHKVVRKVKASQELYGKVTGLIDTPAKFEAHRAELAKRVWKPCRRPIPANAELPQFRGHESGEAGRCGERAPHRLEQGRTCIDCHRASRTRCPRIAEFTL